MAPAVAAAADATVPSGASGTAKENPGGAAAASPPPPPAAGSGGRTPLGRRTNAATPTGGGGGTKPPKSRRRHSAKGRQLGAATTVVALCSSDRSVTATTARQEREEARDAREQSSRPSKLPPPSPAHSSSSLNALRKSLRATLSNRKEATTHHSATGVRSGPRTAVTTSPETQSRVEEKSRCATTTQPPRSKSPIPGSVQGLRRSVRATLSAKKKKKKQPTPGPIAAASVMTPKSLLKREMTFGGEQQQDESLLFSPAANPAPRTTLPPPRRAAAAARQTSEKKVPRRGRSAPTDAEKATAPNSARVDAKKSSLRTEVEKENAVNKACATVDSRDAKAKQPVNIATRIRRTCAPRPRLTERTRVNQRQGVSRKPAVGPDKTQQEPPTTEKKDPVELVAANNPTNRQPRKNSPPASETRSVKTVKTVHPLPATVTKPTTKTVATGRPPDTGPIRDSPETVSSRHHWSSSMPASALHASRAVATPFTTRGNGVCMDLSDIFFDAAVKSSVKRPPPVVPGTHRRPRRDLHRSAMKPKNPVTQQIEQEDAQWADKQCETFSKWLNYTFQPNEDKDHEQEQGVDRTAFRTLVLHQRLAQARLGALEVFNGDDMNKVRAIVLSEINRGRIAVRKDRDMKADLTMRNQITTLLLQYSTPWLRLGLETLFGEAILPEQPIQFSPRGGKPTGASRKPPHCRMKLALKNFIVQRVISDEKVLAKYTNGKCLVPSGKFEVQYRAELRTLVLFRLLVLFIFLDRAKMKNVLDKAPRLFCKGSFVKSTRDVLLSFCRDFLKAEGDFVKHLSRVGLKVFYKQDQLDELDFEIENLATDLRDGVRLVRMTEILTGAAPKSMLARLRLPATSRLQKLHNVGLALKGLAEFGVPISSDLAAHHIVDGHREMVLKLMWSVVAHCCLSNLVDVERVKAEIERLTKSRSKTMQGDDELTSLLVQWCDAVCSRFGRSVKDLTRDLADGKATCYLIHYYHPTLLRRSDIKQTSKDLPASGPPPSKDTVTILLANERSNAFLANKRMAELGGIPAMVPICDATNPPDEKTMLLCIAFMCSRLLESNMENRACLLIQNCYRKHLSRILLKRKKVAASKILATWRTNREAYFRAQRQKYGSAVSVIESFVASRRVILSDLRRRRLARERTYLAAALLQKRARGFLARRSFVALLFQRQAAVKIQSLWRQYQARCSYVKFVIEKDAATAMQRFWRRQSVKRHFAATNIQRIWRGFWAQLQYQIDVLDIITVQSRVRLYLVKRKLNEHFFAAVTLQRATRKFLQNKRLKQERRRCLAACKLQTVFRQVQARKTLHYLRQRVNAAVSIQSHWRKHQAQVFFARMQLNSARMLAAVSVQSHWRKYQAQRLLAAKQLEAVKTLAATSMQSHWRKCQAQRLFASMQLDAARTKSATTIQAQWRRYHAHRLLTDNLRSATLLQAYARSWALQRRFQIARSSAVTIQANWRSRRMVKRFKGEARQVVICQSVVRGWYAQRERKRRLNGILLLQCLGRRLCARRRLVELRRLRLERETAAVTLQRYLRGFCCLVRFRLDLHDVILLQSACRRFLAQAVCRRRRDAIVCIQLASRRYTAQRRLQALIIEREARQIAEKKAANQIQASYRGHLVRRELRNLHLCAVLIQKIWRSYIARMDFQLDLTDIIFVQSAIRRWLAECVADNRLRSVVSLQCFARVCLARIEYGSRVLAKRRAETEEFSATILQCAARGFLARRWASREFAARSIQKTWRCYTVHVEYMLMILAAIEIQANIRRHLTVLEFRLKCCAVGKIQAFGRHALRVIRAERRQVLEKMSAIILQSFFRMASVRSAFLLERTAAVLIQRVARGFIVRIELEFEHFAATEIQRIWRGYDASANFAWIIISAIKIQSAMRVDLAKIQAERIRDEITASQHLRTRSVTKVQRAYRQYMHRVRLFNAAMIIQKSVRIFLSRLTFGRLRKAVCRVQSIVRGMLVRKHAHKKMKARLRSIRLANSVAAADPSLKLGNRTRAALDVLQTSSSLSEIMNTVCILEIATRLSEACCSAFASAGAPAILFSLIRTCNRSLPHIKLLHGILLVLSNVAQYEYLLPSLATTDGVEVFLDLVQMFRDKDFVFCLAVSLLERVVHFSDDFMAVCRSQENLKRLKGVHALCVRKLSISGSVVPPSRRESLDGSLRFASVHREKGRYNGTAQRGDLRQGVRTLHRIIRTVEGGSSQRHRQL